MKKLLILLSLISTIAMADSFDASVGALSDYRFRGISQSDLKPSAISQEEYTADNGIWLGNKLDTVSKQEYLNGTGIESDYYAGWTHKFDDIKIYVGDYEYTYPGATNYNTNEVFAQLRYSNITLKYYRSLTDYFAIPGTTGTQYYSVDYYLPIKDVTFVSHVGHTQNAYSYSDWKFGPTMNIYGVDASLSYYWNSGMSSDFKLMNTVNGNQLYRNSVVLGLSKSF